MFHPFFPGSWRPRFFWRGNALGMPSEIFPRGRRDLINRCARVAHKGSCQHAVSYKAGNNPIAVSTGSAARVVFKPWLKLVPFLCGQIAQMVDQYFILVLLCSPSAEVFVSPFDHIGKEPSD